MQGELMFNCTVHDACSLLSIHAADMNNSLQGHCFNGGCRHMKVYCPKTSTNGECNIDCQGSPGCQYLTLVIDNHFTETANLNCGASSTSCSNTQILCNNNNGKTMMEYVSNQWQCGNLACCPFEKGNITCAAGSVCQIDCSGTNCGGYYIDAQWLIPLQSTVLLIAHVKAQKCIVPPPRMLLVLLTVRINIRAQMRSSTQGMIIM
eukprot:1158081_1